MNFAKRLTLIAVMFLATSTVLYAQPGEPIEGPEQHCYGVAMVGYDSVINSRLGVPAEHALELAATHKVSGTNHYQPFLLKVVLDAYLWEKTPHNYAVKVMYSCAAADVQLYTAKVDTIQ